jgi:hypothetical protein
MRPVGRVLAAQALPVGAAAAAFILATARGPSDSDMFWHLATAKWAIDHGALLRQDVFSSTVAGQPYAVGEWLGELILYAAYALGGWGGIAFLRGLLVATFAFFAARLVRRSGAPPIVTLPLIVAVLLVSAITWTDRPQLWTLAFTPALLDLLFAIRAGRTRLLLVLPPLFLLWANVHGGYPLGLAITGAFAVEALVLRRPHAVRLAAVLVACAAVTLIDPAPFDAGTTAREDALAPPRFITEFFPPDVLTPAGALFAALVLGTVAAALTRGGEPLDALLLIPLLWLALSAQRHMAFFACAAAPFIAARVTVGGRWRGPALPPAPRAALAASLVIAASVAAAFVPAVPDERTYPAPALAALRDGSGRLFNEYDWGGWLIWNAPQRPVFVDGRYVPYLGGGVLADFRAALGLAPGWRDVLTRYDVREALLRPTRPLAVALVEDGWVIVARDDSFVYLRRP